MKTIHIDIKEQQSDHEYDQAVTNTFGDLTIELREEGKESIFLTAVEEKKTGVVRNTVYGIDIEDFCVSLSQKFETSFIFKDLFDRGFHWPNIIFNLRKDYIEILAFADEEFHPNYPIRYLTTGEFKVSNDSLKEAITSLNKKFNFRIFFCNIN